MAMPTEKPSFGTLDGVKVVYAAVELACPKACDLMADWGADVTSRTLVQVTPSATPPTLSRLNAVTSVLLLSTTSLKRVRKSSSR